MKLKHILLAVIGIAAIALAASCKKDDTKQLDKALLNGQWLAGYIVVNNTPQTSSPYTLFDIDADNGKVSVFRYYGDDILNSPLTIEDRTLTINKVVLNLIDKGEITDISVEDAITTYIVGLLRSVRFGAAEAHGIANMMCYNYLFENGAFTRNGNGTYHIDYDKARKAMEGWIALILKTQAEGDFAFASQYSKDNGTIKAELQNDLDRINKSGIPRDIRFNQGLDVLGIK